MNDLVKSENDYGVNVAGMPMGLAIMFNDKLYDRVKQIAGVMSRAEGFTPPHLLGKTEACFAVVTRAITWKLDPQAVAQSTYQTPGGRVGYEGKLIQAILENSGRLEGNVKYDLYGDWTKIRGNFEIKRSEKGKDFAVPKWTRMDARAGKCGVKVSAQVKGEAEPRTLDFDLETAFPLNSTLWATRPEQQIKYTACRAFGNTVAPGILMGEPFDIDRNLGEGLKDVTPARPRREEFADAEEASNLSGIDAPNTPAEADATSEGEQVDRETGEVTKAEGNGQGEGGEESDYGPPEALNDGAKDRAAGKPRASVPATIKDQEHLVEAWQQGWDTEDERIQTEKTKKK